MKYDGLRPVEKDIKDTIEDFFYEKTKDFVFNYYEDDERQKDVSNIVCDCIEEILDSFRYYDEKLDEFLEDYEFHREENLKEYEWQIKNREY